MSYLFWGHANLWNAYHSNFSLGAVKMSIRCLSKLKLSMAFLKEPLENRNDLYIYLIKREMPEIF